MLGLLWHMYALPQETRFISYSELCVLLDVDSAWTGEPADLFAELLKNRKSNNGDTATLRGLLGDLEDEYKVPRDNLNTVFNKAFQQTGLFEYALSGGRMVGIAISTNLDPVLQERIRFILDHPLIWSSGEWSEFVQERDVDLPQKLSRATSYVIEEHFTFDFINLLARCASDFCDCGLRQPPALIHRSAASLLSKRFLIVTGLAGSGKTKLAQAFARWMSESAECYEVVPVGADWTGSENVLGYPNGLDKGEYISKPALELILHASTKPKTPHFLILDEMNLSHVERYFADLLSMIESDEAITLYCDKKGADDIPENTRGLEPKLKLPKNLFIIGTVNVDETTYMFSPKVLDRANVIEFRMEAAEMDDFLDNLAKPELSKLDGKGHEAGFSKPFVEAVQSSVTVPAEVKSDYDAEMLLFFKVLQAHGSEFGYRTAYETARFLHFFKLLGNLPVDGNPWFPGAFDCVVAQKFLPKLHGSESKLRGLLWALAHLCSESREWDEDKAKRTVQVEARAKEAIAKGASKSSDDSPSGILEKKFGGDPKAAPYPLSSEKIERMWRAVKANGFTSFAES